MDPSLDHTTRRIPGLPPTEFQEWNDSPGDGYNKEPRVQIHTIRSSDSGDFVQSVYGGTDLPFFGPQYGIPTPSRRKAKRKDVESRNAEQTTVIRIGQLNPYEDMMRNADTDLQRAYIESLKSSNAPEVHTESRYVELISCHD